ncbi:MAG: 16S rRNA (cytosine(967)-C(5))-methyltransferase RsmB [Candidatus Polarisedimenticolaceae bacterium]|nr:16S rRNA (cytosine(967)-C(5))-methyltransferase RsmB [Candidatus Polarisedimenticolaceae bacterium]
MVDRGAKRRSKGRGTHLNSNPRAIAARMIHQVVGGRSLSDILRRDLEQAGPEDRPLIQELCYGVMRWYPRLDALLQLLLERPLKAREGDIRALILAGCYQLLYMRVADHAAVAETVEAAKALGKPWAVGLVNGLLRRLQREQDQLLERLADNPVAQSAHPAWLLEMIKTAWPEQWQDIIEASNQRPPMSLRVNLRRQDRDHYAAQLKRQGIAASAIPGLPTALILERPQDVHELPGFLDGSVSVQDAGAQIAAGLLDLQPGQRVLDACAAPGGKSGHILEAEPALALLVALDVDATRLERVKENLQRLKLSAQLCQGDASAPAGEWAQQPYDRILLDLPCSATGVIRRHPDIKLLRRKKDIPALAALQSQILDAIWSLLAPGGKLLYCTCSLLPDENEQQVAQFLQRQPDAQELPITASRGHKRSCGRQVLPGEQTMDGFYYALLEKRG